jgi:hypothetical protein
MNLFAPFSAHGNEGWKWIYDQLKNSAKTWDVSLVLDDYVDNNCVQPHTGPWVGIFHHPECLGVPSGIAGRSLRQTLATIKGDAAKNLRAAICFTENVYWALKKSNVIPSDVPIHIVSMPMRPQQEFYKLGQENEFRFLTSIGTHLRNTRVLYQFPQLVGFGKVAITGRNPQTCHVTARYPTVDTLVEPLGDLGDLYHKTLCKSIIVSEYLDASASTVLMDCIAHNTPHLVNWHPSIVEYLGKNYPFYYDKVPNCHINLTYSQIADAWYYLREMDKSRFDISRFILDVQAIVLSADNS